ASLWQAYRGLRLIRSFPTRRSSDLGQAKEGISSEGRSEDRGHNQNRETAREKCGQKRADYQAKDDHPLPVNFWLDLPVVGHLSRSEEHTSELQSRENLVCRLLLEKE